MKTENETAEEVTSLPPKLDQMLDQKKRKQRVPSWVYFGAHSGGHGCWRRWEECNQVVTQEGYLVLRVYVSPRSHAFYPGPGTWLRAFGVMNDVTAADNVWMPKKDDYENAHAQSWSTSHFQVKRGINGPQNCIDPSVSSITFSQRAFGLAFASVRGRLAQQPRITVLAGPLAVPTPE